MTTDPKPLDFDDVLTAEQRQLRAGTGETAVCLSGGGVRSASFGLGVMQGLSEAGVLDSVDYLSTVSGGGYIGGWLSAWRLRAENDGVPDPVNELHRAREPEPIKRLRDYIKYLDPHTGWLSADAWTLGGTIARNLMVTWLLLIPIIAVGVMVPRIYLGVLGLPSQPELVSRATLDWWYLHDWIVILPLTALTGLYAAFELPSLGRRTHGTGRFIAMFLVPALLVHVLFSIHRFWATRFGTTPSLPIEVGLAGAAMVLPWVVGGFFSTRWWRPWTWFAAAASGMVGRLLTASVHNFLASQASDYPQQFTVIDLPISMAFLFLQFSAFVGLASHDLSDDDREWWARAGAWMLMAGAVWFGAAAVAIIGPLALDSALAFLAVSHSGGITLESVAALTAGIATRWIAARAALGGTGMQRLTRILASITGPLALVLLLVLVSDLDRLLLVGLHNVNLFNELPHPVGASLPEDLLALGGLIVVSFALGSVISANEFSLHDMYRARLVRTFLGVSRKPSDRSPDRFTGFDAKDDVPIDALTATARPFHVVNATMDLVADRSLSMSERKAASFTMTALHSGSHATGYRPSSAFGGGISLGQAMTTSGAAVSPNMGRGSSSTMTFLLTLFNARLGTWMGNPARSDWKRPSPEFGLRTLVNELLGRTTDTNPYIYLSDGGHFENLGLYEMIARRCRSIVVVDAGADPNYCYDDLANAIRLVRIDFGVEIDFPSGVKIGPPANTGRFAVGRIRYKAVDPSVEDGVLLYMKPALTGDEPIDVINYSKAHTDFPHESTTDQWFDSAQFDAYRVLGWHTVRAVCQGKRAASVQELCRTISEDTTWAHTHAG